MADVLRRVSSTETLLLRLRSGMMSFGAPTIDGNNPTYTFATRSMVTGLLANALGWDRTDSSKLDKLQSALIVATREDRSGLPLEDYQTVQLGQAHLAIPGWTTSGRPEERGGLNGLNTHIRRRHYVEDAVYTVAVKLRKLDGIPSLEDIVEVLHRPRRPLFFGRKSCIPSEPIFAGIQSASLLQALYKHPLHRHHRSLLVRAWWPRSEPLCDGVTPSAEVVAYDTNDWSNQIHTGRQILLVGSMNYLPLAHAS